MFPYAIQRAFSPLAIAMTAKIHGVDMKIFTQRASHPIPVAGMIQATVNQYESRLALLPPVPEL